MSTMKWMSGFNTIRSAQKYISSKNDEPAQKYVGVVFGGQDEHKLIGSLLD